MNLADIGQTLVQARQYADQQHTALRTAATKTFTDLLNQGMNQDDAARTAAQLHGLHENEMPRYLPHAPTDRFGYQEQVQILKNRGAADTQKHRNAANALLGLLRATPNTENANLGMFRQPFEDLGVTLPPEADQVVFTPAAKQAQETRNTGTMNVANANNASRERIGRLNNLIRFQVGVGGNAARSGEDLGSYFGRNAGILNPAETAAGGTTVTPTPGAKAISTPAVQQRATAASAADATKRYGIDKNYTIHDLEIDLHNRALAETRAHHERQDKAMLYATDQRARAAMDRNETTKELAKIRNGASFYGPKLSQLSAHDRTQLNDLTYQRALAYKARETAQRDLDYATSNNDKTDIATAQAALDDAQGKVDAISAHIEDFFSAVTPGNEPATPEIVTPTQSYEGANSGFAPGRLSPPPGFAQGAPRIMPEGLPRAYASQPARRAMQGTTLVPQKVGGRTVYKSVLTGPHPMPRTKQTKLFP